jgi:TolA-binding protein
MKLYRQNYLTAQEKSLVETHLLDCELCSDALEGMGLIENPLDFEKQVKQLNKQINKRKNERNKILYAPMRLALAACAITLLFLALGIYFNLFIHTQFQHQVADKIDNLKKEMSVITRFNSKPKVDTVISIINNLPVNDVAMNTGSVEDTTNASPITTLDAYNQTDSLAPIKLASALSENESPATVADDVAFTDNNKELNGKPSLRNLSVENTRDLLQNPKAETENKLATAKLPVNKQNADDKIKSTNVRNQTESTTIAATESDKKIVLLRQHLQSGVDYFQKEKFIESIHQFDYVIINGEESIYFDDARYYKAVCHFKIDDMATSRAIFNEILAENGKYSNQAQYYLNLINNK